LQAFGFVWGRLAGTTMNSKWSGSFSAFAASSVSVSLSSKISLMSSLEAG